MNLTVDKIHYECYSNEHLNIIYKERFSILINSNFKDVLVYGSDFENLHNKNIVSSLL